MEIIIKINHIRFEYKMLNKFQENAQNEEGGVTYFL